MNRAVLTLGLIARFIRMTLLCLFMLLATTPADKRCISLQQEDR